ncbi:MAG TPA: septum formation initiator family protein [Blastocatellia bacterium]|nr:septum formation initiator family protein [Blastocatellia bacterium]
MIRAASAQWENAIGSATRVSPIARRGLRVRRLMDAIILAIVLAASALCVEFYLRSRGELALALNRNQAAAEKVGALSVKIEKLERDVLAIRTDPQVIERFARQRFGFVRPGDLVVRIKESPAAEDYRAANAEQALATRTSEDSDSISRNSVFANNQSPSTERVQPSPRPRAKAEARHSQLIQATRPRFATTGHQTIGSQSETVRSQPPVKPGP